MHRRKAEPIAALLILVGMITARVVGGQVLTDLEGVVTWKNNRSPIQATSLDGHKFTPLFKCVFFGLLPRYDPKSGIYTLTTTNWMLKGKVGSKKYTLNGASASFSVAPRMHRWQMHVDYNPPRDLIDWDLLSLPLDEIATLRGFKIGKKSSHFTFTVIAPKPSHATPIQKFGWQEVAPPLLQRNNTLEMKPRLRLGSYGGYIEFTIKNRSNKPYLVSKEFIFVETSDGTIISGDDIGGSTFGNPPFQIAPNHVSDLIKTDPLDFPGGFKNPIKRIFYADGINAFVWKVRATKKK